MSCRKSSSPLYYNEAQRSWVHQGFPHLHPVPGKVGAIGELEEGGRRGRLAAPSYSMQPSGPGAWAGGGGRAAAGDLLSSHGKIGL